MPTYEFRCPKGHEFEKFYRSMSAAQLQVPCPTCGLPAERQVSAGAGLVFKGSGFYITDYGKDGKKSANAASDSASSASDSAGSKSSATQGGTTEKTASSEKRDAKPTTETKLSSDSKPATASKSAAKKSSGKAKSSE